MGRTVVITGATSGIGLHTALGLAAAGCDLVLVARSQERALRAREQVRAVATNGARVEIELADLASLAQVESLATRLIDRYPEIGVLINNAGTFTARRTLSPDSIILDMAVNHVAPFLLTWRLLPLLRRNEGARVINVNSAMHRMGTLSPIDLSREAPYSVASAYAKSKLANLAATMEFALRISAQEVTVNAVHPGLVASDLGTKVGGLVGWLWDRAKPLMTSPEAGARTPLWLATADEVAGRTGGYYINCALAPTSPRARAPLVRTMVWERTLDLLGIDTLAPDLG